MPGGHTEFSLFLTFPPPLFPWSPETRTGSEKFLKYQGIPRQPVWEITDAYVHMKTELLGWCKNDEISYNSISW